MKRIAREKLLTWKSLPTRKPLLIRGARQVGKTWLMKEFGREEYAQTVYVNFESNKRLKTIFDADFDIARILVALEIETGISIEATNTLIIFDEIQEAENALTALKYFYENAPELHVVCAASLLGVALTRQTSFPVGKVDILNLFPLNFTEFLMALEEQALLKLLESNDWEMIKTFSDKYIQLLKQYYYIGGMPEAVSSYIKTKDFNQVRAIQQTILLAYEQDFSKHAPNDIVPRIRMLWNAVPAQLAKENKKFIYGLIKKGARAKEYELAISWLIDCGLIHKINRVNKPAIPLKAYEDIGAFKLYLVDIGLLYALVNLDIKKLLEGNAVFEEFKGAVTEQYTLQQLVTEPEFNNYYWSAKNGTAEIDFLIQYNSNIIPVEVKPSVNLKAKSLKIFSQTYNPAYAFRIAMTDYKKEEWLINLPLYAIGELKKAIV